MAAQLRIELLDDSIGCLTSLKVLSLEGNLITYLPKNFTRLRKLEEMSVARNKLYELPAMIGQLTAMTKLDLDLNRLETLPDTLSALRNLRQLSICRNKMYLLPDYVCDLRHLRVLSLDSNELNRLPVRLGKLELTTLRLSANRIEQLDDDVLHPNLVTSLESLWLTANNLLELPASFMQIENTADLHIEYNPMTSPPAEVIAEGMLVVKQYCRIRNERIHELAELLRESYFETNEDNYTPQAHMSLTGKTGFLTPDDLRDFDQAVDALVNGASSSAPSRRPRSSTRSTSCGTSARPCSTTTSCRSCSKSWARRRRARSAASR